MVSELLVLISGKQGSGKTTTSVRLEQMLYAKMINTKVFKFAGVLYEIHNTVIDIVGKYYPLPKTPQKSLLQLIGTEWGRLQVDNDIWVKITQAKLGEWLGLSEKPCVAIIDDCRFQNEFLIDVKNKLTVRLECNEIIRQARCEAWRNNTEHPSETSLDKFADQGEFDLFYDTGLYSVESIAGDILRNILK